jgi:ABC-2 type transport system permease protein
MKSKKSFFKNGLIKQDFRQHGWIGIIYFICLLFAVPLELMQLASRDFVNYGDYKNYLYVNTELQALFIFAIPVAAALLLFRYLQNESSVDMIHSLPIRREVLYISHIISGLLLLLIPILLTSIITFFVTRSIEEFDLLLSLSDLLSWTGLIILLTCMMFLFTVAVGMMTGMSSAQAILTYIFLFSPLAMAAMISANLSLLLFGFSSIFIEENLSYLSPFLRFVETWSSAPPFSSLELIIYTILTICLFFIGIGLYKARHLERATDVIAFSFLKPVFKYGVTFSCMIVGGSYFSATSTNNWSWTVFGYISGALLGYAIAEMILQKTWRIFHYKIFIGFAVYSIIFIITIFSIKTDLIQFENKLPRMDQISEVYYGNRYEIQELLRNDEKLFSDSKMYIQDVRNLHESIIAQKEHITTLIDKDVNAEDVVIVYRLNNGKLFTREYSLPIDVVKDKLKAVVESESYKVNLPDYKLLRDDILSIKITPYGPVSDQVIISDQQEIKEFRQVIETELLNQTLDHLVDQTSPWAFIEFTYKQTKTDDERLFEGYSIDWKKSYKTISKWLEEHGHLDDARIDSDDILKAEVTKISRNGDKNQEIYNPDELFNLGEQFITIKDKDDLSNTIEKFTEYTQEEHTYFIKLTLKDRNEWYGSLADEHVPDEIKDQFK